MAKKEKTARALYIRETRSDVGRERYAHVSVTFINVVQRPGMGGFSEPAPEWLREYGENDAGLASVSMSTQVSMMDGDEGPRSYSWAVGMHANLSENHPRPLHEIERTVKALRAIDATYEKNRVRFGHPSSFGQYVAFCVDALNVTQVMMERSAEDRNDFGTRYRVSSADNLPWLVNELVARAQKWVARDEERATLKLASGE